MNGIEASDQFGRTNEAERSKLDPPNGTADNEASSSSLSDLCSTGDILYFPNFVSQSEEQTLLERVYAAPKPKWRLLAHRRLQNWGGEMMQDCLLQDEPLPEWLNECVDKVTAITADLPDARTNFPPENRPNHVLINEYLPGQGIMPHTDGPAFYPLISTISLGSHTVLDLYEQNVQNPESARTRVGSLLLEARSLVLIGGRGYRLLHGISERQIDAVDSSELFNAHLLGGSGLASELQRETRVSLTIRNVPKVKGAAIGLMRSKLFRK